MFFRFLSKPSLFGQHLPSAIVFPITFLRHPYYLLRHKRGDVATCLYGVADERAADVIESGVEEADGRGEGGDVDVATRARIDGDGVVGDDVFVMIPTAEHFPVVGSYEERELAVGVGGEERLQRVPHIGGTRQGELEVAGFQLGVGGERHAGHLQTEAVVEEVATLLQRILRRHHQPHLVKSRKLSHLAGYGDVSVVYGIERTAVDAGLYLVHACEFLFLDKLLDGGVSVLHGAVEVVVDDNAVEVGSLRQLELSACYALLYSACLFAISLFKSLIF